MLINVLIQQQLTWMEAICVIKENALPFVEMDFCLKLKHVTMVLGMKLVVRGIVPKLDLDLNALEEAVLRQQIAQKYAETD